MSEDNILSKFDILEFRGVDTDKYSVWVYAGGHGQPQVYEEEQPNTVEIWFKFYKFSHFYWRLFENECIDETKSGMFYNYNKLRLFMLRRMICSTNLRSVIIEYDRNGVLTDKSFESLMRVHPRILRTLMDKVQVIPKPMNKSEERELERQCSILFGKGEGVSNPHEYIATYCNLVAFWDKFGMNYFDILKLPQDVFSSLKKVMTLENVNRSAKMDEMSRQSQNASRQYGRGGRSVRF